ncbi:patatin-like phospholipase domain-containing protein 2 [Myripristis murdjan]|uniref:patatin-like phospholipase domain-containing protein 2 n=1 Tax=Myripristis murdjan TaxID=586833 RepID=UPI00117639B2|nr:patatin-like phospholipase domain-containing protein 2 [Myripristis murdjan]
MGGSAKINSEEEWNISLAGCGFRSIYYLGALSCMLEWAPRLVHCASKICGASSGCLVAAGLTVGIPIEKCCADVISIAKEARKCKLGVFHPGFNLLQIVQHSLLVNLPEDAHVRASGRLCVSLTRVSDGKNVLVSEFDSREELIQVLMCSCFFPVYCGVIPPSYRGVLYMDGALSNNMPLSEQGNTITMAPFSGESDICPREGTFNALEVHYGNVSIQVNTGNVHRVWTSFFPPKPEMLAEICHHGYMDALRFLKENEYLSPSMVAEMDPLKAACCEMGKQSTEAAKAQLSGLNCLQEEHRGLDQRLIENLPVSIKKVLCDECRDKHEGGGLLSEVNKLFPVKVASYLLIPCTLPAEITFLLAKSVILSGCTAMCRLLVSGLDFYRQMLRRGFEDTDRLYLHSEAQTQVRNSGIRGKGENFDINLQNK